MESRKGEKTLQEKEELLNKKEEILVVFQVRIISLNKKIKEGALLEKDVGHLEDVAKRIVKKYYSGDGQHFLGLEMDEKTLIEALAEIRKFNLSTEKYIT